jgi:hypothetical protein
MREIILAMAIPLAVLIASPAMAVKVVPRDDRPQRENAGPNYDMPGQADSPSTTADQKRPSKVDPTTAQTHDSGVRHEGRPSVGPSKRIDSTRNEPNSTRDRRIGPTPEPAKGGPCARRDIRGNDNFIDENHDGIDDRLQRPPEVIKKREPKREHGPEQPPQRLPEKERQRVRDHEREQVKRSR